jgi:hypothetical protein
VPSLGDASPPIKDAYPGWSFTQSPPVLTQTERPPSCTYLLPAPPSPVVSASSSVSTSPFRPGIQIVLSSDAKPIECKTQSFPAVSEDVVGRLIKMPVKSRCETEAKLGERYILLVFIANEPMAQYRYAHPAALSACMHMPCDRVSPLPRAPSPSKLALLTPTTRTQSE